MNLGASALSIEVAIRRAFEIHRALQLSGGQCQVRWHKGRLLTYCYPAPRSHGVRGELVGVYSATGKREWLEADLVEFAQQFVRASDTCAPDFACSV